MAALKQVFGSSPNPILEVSDTTTTIGRHEDCDIQIDSPAISRFHSHIVCEKGRYFLEDLNSRNGTILNGIPVTSRMLLSNGDSVEFSTLPYKFLSQDTLSEASGSWGAKAEVIHISQPAVDCGEDSIRRQVVAHGDRISDDELGSDSVRQAQIVARMTVADPGAGWPVVHCATQKLNFALRLLHALRRTITREEVIAKSLKALFSTFPAAERIAIVMKVPRKKELRIDAAVSRFAQDEVEICLPVIRTSIQNSEAMLYADHWNKGSGKSPELDNPSLRSILAVPMIGLVEECLGVIQIDTTDQTVPLGKEDLELLVILANVIAFALEQSSETQAEVRRAVTERSTADANRLRTSLTAVGAPDVPGYRLVDSLLAAPDVAADFIDYVKMADGRVACFLIDVPGRGPNAANLMAVIARLLSESISETGSASEAIRKTETALEERMRDVPMVISIAVMILDGAASTVAISVAGHCPLFKIQSDAVKVVEIDELAGSPLGAQRDAFQEIELKLSENDIILLVSDGLTKVRSPSDTTFGSEGTLEMLNRCANSSRLEFDSILIKQLHEFRGDTPLVDDVAFAMIHRSKQTDTVDFGFVRKDSETTDA